MGRRGVWAVAAFWAAGAFAANPGQAQSPPTDPETFTEAIADAYRRLGLQARVVRPLELDVRPPIGAGMTVYLDTSFSFCQRDPPGCGAFVVKQAKAMIDTMTPPDGPIRADEVRVTVRPSGYIDQLEAVAKGDPVIAEPLVDDLWIIGVRDQPTTIAMLSKSDLDSLKLAPDAALALGERNLEAQARAAIEAEAGRAATGVAAIHGDDYTASFIASPELWAAQAERFEGQLLVAAPDADTVVFVDGRRPDARSRIAAAGAEAAQRAKRPISRAILEWTPTGWNKVGDFDTKP